MLIDGKQTAGEILGDVETEVKKMDKPLRIAAVCVGKNNSAEKFLKLKKTAAEKIGIEFEIYQFPENITTQE